MDGWEGLNFQTRAYWVGQLDILPNAKRTK